MSRSRRAVLLSLAASALGATQQENPPNFPPRPVPENPEPPPEDDRLPNGKSRKMALAKEQHEQMLKDADDLITLSQQLKQELQKAGDYVLPLSCVKKTEEIEKLARRVRGRLKQ